IHLPRRVLQRGVGPAGPRRGDPREAPQRPDRLAQALLPEALREVRGPRGCMSLHEQVVQISARATSFTAVCEECAELDGGEGYAGATFAGRLELDRGHATFLCRRGHSVRVERAAAAIAETAA